MALAGAQARIVPVAAAAGAAAPQQRLRLLGLGLVVHAGAEHGLAAAVEGRREAITAALERTGKLTPALRRELAAADSLR